MSERKAKIGISVDRHDLGIWNFGICFFHAFPETYIFINFASWSVSIGWLEQEGIYD